MIPIPELQKQLLEKAANDRKGNFSLYFSRMTLLNDKGKKLDDSILKLKNGGENINSSAGDVLKRVHSKHRGIISHCETMGLLCMELSATLESAYISGLGSGHPTETGMILDRNTGLPYIPASSLKGVLRSVCEDGKLRLKYFGNEPSEKDGSDPVRGQFVILDAYPDVVPALKEDVMTPHFGEYYQGGSAPDDMKNPTPIKFISVKEGTKFVFI